MSPKSCDGWYGGWVPQGMALGHLLGGMGGVADWSVCRSQLLCRVFRRRASLLIAACEPPIVGWFSRTCFTGTVSLGRLCRTCTPLTAVRGLRGLAVRLTFRLDLAASSYVFFSPSFSPGLLRVCHPPHSWHSVVTVVLSASFGCTLPILCQLMHLDFFYNFSYYITYIIL